MWADLNVQKMIVIRLVHKYHKNDMHKDIMRAPRKRENERIRRKFPQVCC